LRCNRRADRQRLFALRTAVCVCTDERKRTPLAAIRYAQYLGGVLNPFDITQAQLAEEGIDKSKPYAQAYLEQAEAKRT
jgi:hypothetical protein